uniref:Uncharacterized protein n=1 Tax=Anguilla anguilla TaxID=7936 RepID=A0A0E9W6C0_ANGAN
MGGFGYWEYDQAAKDTEEQKNRAKHWDKEGNGQCPQQQIGKPLYMPWSVIFMIFTDRIY